MSSSNNEIRKASVGMSRKRSATSLSMAFWSGMIHLAQVRAQCFYCAQLQLLDSAFTALHRFCGFPDALLFREAQFDDATLVAGQAPYGREQLGRSFKPCI